MPPSEPATATDPSGADPHDRRLALPATRTGPPSGTTGCHTDALLALRRHDRERSRVPRAQTRRRVQHDCTAADQETGHAGTGALEPTQEAGFHAVIALHGTRRAV